MGLARELRLLRTPRPRLGRRMVHVVPRPARGSSRGQRGRTRVDSTGWAGWAGWAGSAGGAGGAGTKHALGGLAAKPQSLRDLRDVLRVWLWLVLLLHLAADLSDQGAWLLAVQRRSVRGAAISAGGDRGPRGRLVDGLLDPPARSESRPLLSWVCRVPHMCRVPHRVDARLLAR